MSVKEWADKVEAFLEENQELADDPTLGEMAAQRLLRETMDILVPLSEELNEVTKLYADAAEDLEEVANDPHAFSSTVHKYEKPYEKLKAEYEGLLYCQEKLEPFRSKVHDVYMTRTDEAQIEYWETHGITEEELENTEEVPMDERPTPRKESFLKRLFR